jgi:MerR family redox-sensitive transcriptional activator SoxR
MSEPLLTVGQLAERSGLPVSTLHFYERKGLIASARNAANHRVYRRDALRRVTIIKVAQSAGVPLATIAEALANLPRQAVPDAQDWGRMSEAWRDELSQRIEALTALRDKMDDCIGCGCLSMKRCPLVNGDDHLGAQGAGPQLL